MNTDKTALWQSASATRRIIEPNTATAILADLYGLEWIDYAEVQA